MSREESVTLLCSPVLRRLHGHVACGGVERDPAVICCHPRAHGEAVRITGSGFLCEAGSSNVFIGYQDHLYTPALSEGCVEGVMRQVVIKLARENNIPVTEAQINPDILYEADEVFLTNAGRGIQSVMGFGVRRYFNEVSKLLTDELNKL